MLTTDTNTGRRLTLCFQLPFEAYPSPASLLKDRPHGRWKLTVNSVEHLITRATIFINKRLCDYNTSKSL